MIAYKTSTDYKKLLELLDKGLDIVCFITLEFEGEHIAIFKKDPYSERGVIYSLCSKNSFYYHYRKKTDTFLSFQRECKLLKLRFIKS